VLLFDEPLSNLDAKLRAEMRIELRELQRRLGVTSLYVTHDLEEALAMSDRIVVMRTGKIEQIGTASDIYDRPRTAFVADFVGSANLVAGRPIERAAPSGRIAVDVDGAVLQGVTLGRRVGDEVTLSLRTVHLRLHKTSPSPDHGNVWPVTISKSVFLGDLTQIHVNWGGRELVVRESIPHRYAANQSAFLTIAPENCVVLES
jgi:ABC-type Fe3+/spermidine/putrescine transport system ATPase subunit